MGIGIGLAARRAVGLGLVRGWSSGAVAWWLSGGVSAADCLAAYTPKGAASLAASYDNNAAPGNGLADGTYDAALGVAPTWAAGTGWTFSGAQWLQTSITPTLSTTTLIRFSDMAASGNNVVIGENGLRHFMIPHYAGSGTYWVQANKSHTLAGVYTQTGVMGIAGSVAYLDGVAKNDMAPLAAGAPFNITIGGRGTATTPGLLCTGKVQAVAIYNTTLSGAQVAAVSSAMAAL